MLVPRRRWIHRAHAGLLDELDSCIPLAGDHAVVATGKPSVSAWTVQQHLEHLWRVDRLILGWLAAVRDGQVETDGHGATVPGTVVMWLQRIPRGRGTAPDPTKPSGTTPEDIVEGFRGARNSAQRLAPSLDRLAADPTTRRHHLLGCFTPPQWMRFAHIHHVHHRRLIEDILRA